MATLPAVSPRANAFFQTETVWVPRATRFSAAVSPSWPRDRDLQADGGERLDDAGRHAVVLGQDRVDLVPLALSAASMLFLALVVSQLSVFFSNTTLIRRRSSR